MVDASNLLCALRLPVCESLLIIAPFPRMTSLISIRKQQPVRSEIRERSSQQLNWPSIARHNSCRKVARASCHVEIRPQSSSRGGLRAPRNLCSTETASRSADAFVASSIENSIFCKSKGVARSDSIGRASKGKVSAWTETSSSRAPGMLRDASASLRAARANKKRSQDVCVKFSKSEVG